MTALRLEVATLGDRLQPDWARVRAAVGYAVPDEPAPPGVRAVLAYRGSTPVARLGFGARSDLTGTTGATGFVGWYEAADAEAGAAVLRRARAELGGAVERVVGPLNGSTWGRYRLALPPAEEIPGGVPFLGEPQNPPEYEAHFLVAGFRPHLEYQSRWVPHPAPVRGDDVRVRLAELGVSLQPLDPERWDASVREIYDLSADAFRENPYYAPISHEEFRAQYDRLRPMLDPRLVLLARGEEGRLLGYVFAYPDPLAHPASPRLVLKTLATAPRARGLGLGGALTDQVHQEGRRRGAGVVHALMHVTNASRRISDRSDSQLLRRYRLYEAPPS